MFLGRWSMLHGWLELFRTKFGRKKNEFVSADARHLSNDPRTYEMLSGTGTQLNIRTPDRVLSPNPREGMSPGPIEAALSWHCPCLRQPRLELFLPETSKSTERLGSEIDPRQPWGRLRHEELSRMNNPLSNKR